MRKITLFALFALLSFVLPSDSYAQEGVLDPSFGIGTGANAIVTASDIQSDGKIIIAGSFTTYNGTAINRIARLNQNGSLDTSFDPGSGLNDYPSKIKVLSNGKILIAGNFTSFNGTTINRIARLNQDGSLDTSFNPGSGVNGTIFYFTIQNDGKIIIGGSFSSYNGNPSYRLARVNVNGSFDNSFNQGQGLGVGNIQYITTQNDDKIIIGGSFSSYDGTTRNNIARLNPDGSLDTTFDTGSGTDGVVLCISLQNDDRIIIGGSFSDFNGNTRNNFARLNQDGSLDTSFDPGSGTNNLIWSNLIQSDNKILIVGSFTSYNGTTRNRIARINPDGSLDTTFNPGSGANGNIFTATYQNDGKFIIGGNFTNYNGTAMNRIARITGETLSIDDYGNSIKNVSIYPNPANDHVTINNIPDGSTVAVIDMTGELISSYKNTNNNPTISTVNLVSGIYIVKIENNGSVAHKKLIVKN